MLRPHQAFMRQCISSPLATTDPSVRQLGCSHTVLGDQRGYRFTKHAQKVIHTEFRTNVGILRAQVQRNELQMQWQVKLLKPVCQCSSRFVSGNIVRVPERVRALLRQTCSCVSFACNFSAHVNDTHLFVALKDDWIEETVSFKMLQDFLRQVLTHTFSEHTSPRVSSDVMHG